MKNVVIGTSGHVDHGKTFLIKALTGTDTDRLKEEKKRGITIENGFADLVYGDYNISIIDVPGHERFVRNMLIGIGGIDMVLFVVAMDEGVMPQTKEHFDILTMLNISRGIVVLTKDDAVTDEDWKELVEDDVRSLIKGSFLEDAPFIRVSAMEGYHIEELKSLIVKQLEEVPEREAGSNSFRMPMDRVFTIEGFGTVVTGTLMEGSVSVGDTGTIYPDEKRVKVRNVQVHNEDTKTAYAGQRTALNLANVKKSDINRGKVFAVTGSLCNTMMLDVEIAVFQDAEKAVKHNSRVHFFSGSTESLAKVALLEKDILTAGETGFAQLRIEEEVALKKGDRFIIRFYSPMKTLGGGVVLDANPVKHKRHDESVLENLVIKGHGSESENVEVAVKEAGTHVVTTEEISNRLNLKLNRAKSILERLQKEQIIHSIGSDAYIHSKYIDAIRGYTKQLLDDYHRDYPLSQGMPKEEMRNKLSIKFPINDSKQFEQIMGDLAADRIIEFSVNGIKAKGYVATLSKEMIAAKETLEMIYVNAGFKMPETEDVDIDKWDKKQVGDILKAMETEGTLVKLSFQYNIHKDWYNQALEIVTATIQKNGSISLGEFRDLIGTSRKYAMELLNYMDEKKITKIVDDVRVLS